MRPTKRVRRRLARFYRQRRRALARWQREDTSGHAWAFRRAASRFWLARLRRR